MNGKPRGDDTDMDMQTTRLRFKYALRQCRCDEEQNRADALARSLHYIKTRQISGRALGVSKTAGSR